MWLTILGLDSSYKQPPQTLLLFSWRMFKHLFFGEKLKIHKNLEILLQCMTMYSSPSVNNYQLVLSCIVFTFIYCLFPTEWNNLRQIPAIIYCHLPILQCISLQSNISIKEKHTTLKSLFHP